jgi:serine/threonine protein kinase
MADWITPARWQQLEPLLDAALDLPEADRDAFVATSTASDPALRDELGALLLDASRVTELPMLDRSAGEVFTTLLRDDSEIVARLFAEELADRYTILKRIGAGGMATVYLAHDVRHDREVAIKILHPDLTETIGSARFEREIKVTAKLQHPHLLPLLDSGEAGGQLFFVMPYIAGESLRARLDREKMLPVDDALRITREVASALDNAHRHGAVHRDIKPENILMHEGQALVADWGIALPTTGTERKPLTADGFRLGTPQYMSPEQSIGDRALDARSDVYSLGIVLYEMLTGAPPFTGETPQIVIDKVKNAPPEPPTTARATIPPRIEAAVLKALAKLPADRFRSAAEFAAALSDPESGSAGQATSSRTLTVGLAILVTLLAAALTVVVYRKGF